MRTEALRLWGAASSQAEYDQLSMTHLVSAFVTTDAKVSRRSSASIPVFVRIEMDDPWRVRVPRAGGILMSAAIAHQGAIDALRRRFPGSPICLAIADILGLGSPATSSVDYVLLEQIDSQSVALARSRPPGPQLVMKAANEHEVLEAARAGAYAALVTPAVLDDLIASAGAVPNAGRDRGSFSAAAPATDHATGDTSSARQPIPLLELRGMADRR